jgi:hypothetical protein
MSGTEAGEGVDAPEFEIKRDHPVIRVRSTSTPSIGTTPPAKRVAPPRGTRGSPMPFGPTHQRQHAFGACRCHNGAGRRGEAAALGGVVTAGGQITVE